jgi:hypothetical protein
MYTCTYTFIVDSHGAMKGDGKEENIKSNDSKSHLNALYECDLPTFLLWYSGDLNKLGPGVGLDGMYSIFPIMCMKTCV